MPGIMHIYVRSTYLHVYQTCKHVKLSPSIDKSKETLVIARKVVIIVVNVTH